MNIVLLSGGSGTRLWPLSNEVRSKQFLRIFRLADGSYESMVQRVYRMIKETNPSADITIATSEKQMEALKSQLGSDIAISIEPCRRNTFPAIALAAAYLRDIKGASEEEFTVVCPIDSLVEKEFFAAFSQMEKRLTEAGDNLVLMGIKPTEPSDKYGYIVPEEGGEASSVRRFTEKPDREHAKVLMDEGALWNGGVFGFRLGYVLRKAEELLGTASYTELFEQYASLTKISFDYAVSEHEPRIGVVRYDGVWEDIGTWDTLTKAMHGDTIGDVTAERCDNVSVINELGVPLVAFGLQDVVIAASPDGILVSGKEDSADIRGCVENLSRRPMYEEKGWGHYAVLDYSVNKEGVGSLTKQLVLSSGMHISYQTHEHRAEYWTITSGTGFVILGDETIPVKQGSSISVMPKMRHAIYAQTELTLIEVQLGDDLSEEDILRLPFDWDKFEALMKKE